MMSAVTVLPLASVEEMTLPDRSYSLRVSVPSA